MAQYQITNRPAPIDFECNNDIILRHAYTAGVIEHSLTDDAELQQAVGVLQSPDEYRRITTEQDTKKK